jgi:hypothetical protein
VNAFSREAKAFNGSFIIRSRNIARLSFNCNLSTLWRRVVLLGEALPNFAPRDNGGRDRGIYIVIFKRYHFMNERMKISIPIGRHFALPIVELTEQNESNQTSSAAAWVRVTLNHHVAGSLDRPTKSFDCATGRPLSEEITSDVF